MAKKGPGINFALGMLGIVGLGVWVSKHKRLPFSRKSTPTKIIVERLKLPEVGVGSSWTFSIRVGESIEVEAPEATGKWRVVSEGIGITMTKSKKGTTAFFNITGTRQGNVAIVFSLISPDEEVLAVSDIAIEVQK